MERAEVMAWRKERRADLIAQRMALTSQAHRDASAAILQNLVTLFKPMAPTLVGAYWPFRREYNVLAFLEWLTERRHEIALPVVLGKGQPLEFRRWNRDMKMATGVYDIPYPAQGPAVAPSILVVPVVGFDAAGYRLGYGGGFYDRTLAVSDPKPICVGTGFEVGRLDTIFPLPHDVRMDYIVTEKALMPTGAAPGQ